MEKQLTLAEIQIFQAVVEQLIKNALLLKRKKKELEKKKLLQILLDDFKWK